MISKMSTGYSEFYTTEEVRAKLSDLGYKSVSDTQLQKFMTGKEWLPKLYVHDVDLVISFHFILKIFTHGILSDEKSDLPRSCVK